MVNPAKPKILVVDDSPDNLYVMIEALRNHCTVEVALGGRQALEMALRQPLPEAILLDVMMPDMDGFEVCRQFKNLEASRDIPVLFITILENVNEEQRALAMGAVDFIRKPINPAVLRARVLTHVELARARGLLVGQNRPPNPLSLKGRGGEKFQIQNPLSP
ncbi:hypothetical protein CCP4SC76_2320013 [Gammaproteobacteria bacterium]